MEFKFFHPSTASGEVSNEESVKISVNYKENQILRDTIVRALSTAAAGGIPLSEEAAAEFPVYLEKFIPDVSQQVIVHPELGLEVADLLTEGPLLIDTDFPDINSEAMGRQISIEVSVHLLAGQLPDSLPENFR